MPPERCDKPDSLEARLRRLPPPPVPADLQARLLAAIPAGAPIRRRRWMSWMVGASALAAACLLIVLAWPKRYELPHSPDEENRLSASGSAPSVGPQKSQDVAGSWLQARGAPDDPKPPAFTWPVEETAHITLSSSIPADLLD